MTQAERDVLLARRPDLAERFTPTADEGFWSLAARPCPLLENGRCSVYEVRPYNCRRWGCYRPDPTTEPFSAACFWDRFEADRGVRRAAAVMQRKAQKWARKHGWNDAQ